MKPGLFALSLSLVITFGSLSCLRSNAAVDAGSVEKLRSNIERARSSKKSTELSLALYALGQYFSDARDFAQAEPYLREALFVDRQGKDPNAVFNDLTAVAIVQTCQKHFDEAEKTYLEAAALAAEVKSDKLERSCYTSLGSNAIYAGQYDKAKQYFLKAQEIAAKTNDYVGEAESRYSLALLLKKTGDIKGALEQTQAAKKLLGEGNSEVFYGQVCINLARLKEFVGDMQPAVLDCKEAVQTFNSCGESEPEGDALMTLGNMHLFLGQTEDARRAFDRAAELYRTEENQTKLTSVMVKQGSASADLGNFVEALRLHSEAAAAARTLKNDDLLAQALYECGNDYYLQGASEQALAKFIELSNLIKSGVSLTDSDTQADTLSAIAMCYGAMGQFEAAKNYYQQALDKQKASGSKFGEITCAISLACLYLNSGQESAYKQQYDTVCALLEQVPPADKGSREFKRRDAGVAFNHAQYLNMIGQMDQSLPVYKKAVDGFASLSDKKNELRALNGMGLTYIRLGEKSGKPDDYQAGLKCYLASQPLASACGSPEGQWDCAIGLGTCYRALGDKEKAESNLRKAIGLFEKEKSQLSRDDSKTYSLDLRSASFKELVALLFDQGRFDDALEIVERGRARAFLDLLEGRKSGSVRLAAGDVVPGQKLIATAGSDRAVEVVPRASQFVQDTVVSSASVKAPDLAEIKSLIKESGSTIVEYYVCADKLYIFVASPDGNVKAVAVPVTEVTLTKNVTTAYKEIISPPKSITDLKAGNERRQNALIELNKLLIEPIKTLLPGSADDVITLVPHAGLFKVPFAALLDAGGRMFVEDHTIAVVPAVGVMRATHKLAASAAAGNSLLAFGNPAMKLVGGLGALPYAEKEVNKIAEIFGAPNSTVKIGAAATKAALRELAPKANIIHLATHGLIDEDKPMDSAVLLATTASDDGILSVKDILQLPQLKTKLITLSACQTGRGKISGDGVAGLSRAFIIAGTPSVMVSLWNVDDVMTEYQMNLFYKEYLGGATKARALRNAQLKTVEFMEKGFPQAGARIRANPRYWAAFQMIGEYK